MLILPAEADESVVSGALDRITRVIGEAGGQVGNVDRWLEGMNRWRAKKGPVRTGV